jgi:hypothetical protein
MFYRTLDPTPATLANAAPEHESALACELLVRLNGGDIMKMRLVSTVLSAGVAVGLALGSSAQAEPSSQTGQTQAASEPAPSEGQARIADTTLKLEKAFDAQFVNGKIDRDALKGPIAEVIQAMPEAARPKVQTHIEQVLQAGEKLTSRMTPEQRTEAVAAPAPEHVGKTQQAWAGAWGWPGVAGFGGLGAFGFPGMYYGTGLYGAGLGYGTGLGFGGFGCGFGACGLGTTGWYW